MKLKANRSSFTGNCDICHLPVRPADTQAQFNRNWGIHKSKVHGVRGPQYEGKKGTKPDQKNNGNGSEHEPGSPESILSGRRPGRMAPQPADNVVAAYLNECPQCHSRFYIAKGNSIK